jgi:hypothetical protein
MKLPAVIMAVLLIFGAVALGSETQMDKTEEVLVVYYFGATNIGFCILPENITKIKEIKAGFPNKFKDSKIKFVMVCLDEEINDGLKFIKKYGFWDEISIGKSYHSELAMFTLNKISTPELPHIFVFKDRLSYGKWKLPVIKRRDLLVDLAGEERINEWINKNYPVPYRINAMDEDRSVMLK